MEPALLLVGFVVLIVGYLWLQTRGRRALDRKVFNRAGHREGVAAVKSKLVFEVPGSSAAQVVSSVVASLGYPTTATTMAGTMIVSEQSEDQVSFAYANRFSRSWVSTLSATDVGDGARGEYAVASWHTSDGAPVAWKEMEIIAGRVGRVLEGVGATVTVTAPE